MLDTVNVFVSLFIAVMSAIFVKVEAPVVLYSASPTEISEGTKENFTVVAVGIETTEPIP